MKQKIEGQAPETAVRISLAVSILNLEKPSVEQLAVLNGLIQADPAVRKIVEVYC